MKFRNKDDGTLVEAFPYSDRNSPPPWFIDAVNAGIATFNSGNMDVRPSYVLVRGKERNFYFQGGDWLVREHGGELRTRRSDIFESMYEPVEVSQ